MGFLQRTWTKDTSSESKMYPDSVYMYDAGNFIGILTNKNQRELKQWSGYTVVSRVNTQETVVETLESADEFSVPMRFFSVEKYPAKIEPSILWIPGWKIQLKQQQPRVTEERSDSPLPQSSYHPPRLTKQQHPRQPQPSPRPAQSHRTPSFPSPPKSPSEKQAPSQHSLQNKSNNASRPKASLSSNPVSHEKQRQSTPGMSGEPPLQSSPSDHTVPLLQKHPLPQPSPSPQPPLAPGGSTLPPISSSPNHSNSKYHSPSQRARHPRGGKSQHPSFFQPFSHE